MTELSKLRQANEARQKEWDSGDQITLTYRATELGGEVGEALNIVKKIERERLGIRGSRATLADLADELADVVICADLIAMGEGIDLQAAIERKFNATSEKVGLATQLRLSAALPADGEVGEIERLRSRIKELESALERSNEERLRDLRKLLLAAGMGDHARPCSPAAVFDECLDRIRSLLA